MLALLHDVYMELIQSGEATLVQLVALLRLFLNQVTGKA